LVLAVLAVVAAGARVLAVVRGGRRLHVGLSGLLGALVVRRSVSDVGSAPSPMWPSCMENTGIARTAMVTTPAARNCHGLRATRCAYRCQVPWASAPGSASVSATGFRTW